MTNPNPQANPADAPSVWLAHESAVAFCHQMVTPLLLCGDPQGFTIATDERTREVIVSANDCNMRFLIGRQGSMGLAMRHLMNKVGWGYLIRNARFDGRTPPPARILDVTETVFYVLDIVVGEENWRADETPRQDCDLLIWVHPDHYTERLHMAVEMWAWNAAKAAKSKLKLRMCPAGIVPPPPVTPIPVYDAHPANA